MKSIEDGISVTYNDNNLKEFLELENDRKFLSFIITIDEKLIQNYFEFFFFLNLQKWYFFVKFFQNNNSILFQDFLLRKFNLKL